MASMRRAADGYADAWGRGDGRTRLVLVLGALVGAVLVGAFLFGVWHVVVGGLMKGNPRAGAFGLGLSAVTGVLLALLGYLGGRTARRGPPPP